MKPKTNGKPPSKKGANKRPDPPSGGKAPGKPGPDAQGSRDLPTYDSMAHCFACTGIPVEVQRIAKAQGCPAWRFARVSLGPLLRHLFQPRQDELPLGGKTTPNNVPVTAANQGGSRGELDEWRAKREKIKYLKEADLVILTEEVKADAQQAMAGLFGTLERVFLSELPPALVGMKEIEIFQRNRDEIEAIKVEFTEKITAMIVEDEERVEEDSSESSEETD